MSVRKQQNPIQLLLRVLLFTILLCTYVLQPVSVFAAASDFVGNSDDTCELPAAAESVVTIPVAVLTQEPAQSVTESRQNQINLVATEYFGQDWYWWLVGVLFGGIAIVFIGRMQLGQSR